MRCGLLTSTTVLLLGTGVALAQESVQTQFIQTSQQVADGTPSFSRPIPPPPAVENPPPPPGAVSSPACGAPAVPVEGPGGCSLQGMGENDHHLWIRGEYLLWKLPGTVPPDLAGAISGTGLEANVLVNSLLNDDARSGGRLTGGYWFGCDLGLEVSGLFLEDSNGSFFATSTIDPSLNPSAVPPRLSITPDTSRGIVDTPPDLDAGDLLTSTLTGRSTSSFWGVEANVHSPKLYIGAFTFDLILAGFRNLNLDEDLKLHGDFKFAEPNPDEAIPGPEDGRTLTMHTDDSVSTRNHFYGAQVGGTFDWHCGCFTLDGFAKFAVGGTHELVSISGTTVQDAGLVEPTIGGPLVLRPAGTFNGGLITPALPGTTTTERGRISIVPELNANAGYQVNENLRVFVGYSYMMFTNVVRVGDQSVKSTTSATSDLSVQGLNAGLQFRY